MTEDFVSLDLFDFFRLGNSCLVFLGPSFRSTGDHQSALISPLHWHLKSHHWPGQSEAIIVSHWPIRRLLQTGIKSLTWHLHNYPGNCFYQNFHPGISLSFGSLHAPTWFHQDREERGNPCVGVGLYPSNILQYLLLKVVVCSVYIFLIHQMSDLFSSWV